jgi:protein arginine kinase activator
MKQMLCQDCKQRDAQVHLTQIINNEKTSLSLCKECAAQRGFHSPLENIPFPLAEILSSLTGIGSAPIFGKTQQKEQPDLTCPSCGLTFEAFTRQGRFGCGQCYIAFRSRIEPILRKVHGASLHRGRGPLAGAIAKESTDAVMPVVKEEARLEAELQKAIESEDFERAVEIRDKLKSLRHVEHA